MSGKSARGGNGRRIIEEKEDRISELPDAIILHILSSLYAEDVVRSGVLSRRFYNLWTHISSLHFEQLSLRSVYSTLLIHNLSVLEKLAVVDCDDDDGKFDHDFELGRLLQLLSSSNLKDLSLALLDCNRILPQSLYSISTLKKLRLTDCSIQIKGLVNWKALQSLCLCYVSIADGTMDDILSGCPSLELLDLSECFDFVKINLNDHKCLKKLVIDHYISEGTELVISAPYLQSLVLSGEMLWSGCRIVNAKCLTDCYLGFDHGTSAEDVTDVEIMMSNLLEGLSHVEVVAVGDWVLWILAVIELMELPCPMSETVKCLKLEKLESFGFPGIVSLLRELNHLEKLSINILELRFGIRAGVCNPTYNEWLSENVIAGFDLKLKTVEITGVVARRDLIYYENGILQLVEFVLKNAKVVEEVSISAYGSKQELQELSERVQSYPRSSPCAAVEIIELK